MTHAQFLQLKIIGTILCWKTPSLPIRKETLQNINRFPPTPPAKKNPGKIPCLKFEMGIRSLNSYINKRTPNVRKPTNILKVAENTFRSKVLIVDLNCVLRSSYKDLSLVNGGDFAIFKDRWTVFLHKLEMAEIRPIFVIDGPTCVDKRWKVKFNLL